MTVKLFSPKNNPKCIIFDKNNINLTMLKLTKDSDHRIRPTDGYCVVYTKHSQVNKVLNKFLVPNKPT